MRLPSWTLLALCLALAVAVTVVAFQETETWSAMSQSAEAVVTSVHSQTDLSYNGGPGDTQQISVTVVFTTARGRRVQATQYGSGSERVGERLLISYDPLNPDHVRWSTAVDEAPGAEAAAVLVWGVSVVLLVLWRRKRRSLSAPNGIPVTQ
jgi:hypothetical protein